MPPLESSGYEWLLHAALVAPLAQHQSMASLGIMEGVPVTSTHLHTHIYVTVLLHIQYLL